MSQRLPLPVGTPIVAVKTIGAVEAGAPGMITGAAEFPFLWWSRPFYLCTFAGGVPIAARPKEISTFDHGYSRTELEDPAGVRDLGARIDALILKSAK
jgi:hypothetical protein